MGKENAEMRRGGPEAGLYDTRGGCLYKKGRLLSVSPLLVALCLSQAGLPLVSSKRALPSPVGHRIVRLATFLDASLALTRSRTISPLGGSNERA
jgi:hypothetical protein